ncbi:hypothetical protein [Candidatus Kryptobacter tengchongensis]|uniref:hypothetical protein n=1 Tax=Kryptobacter tengchongensis TaxID=1643429 RepID=UPI0007084F8D|nr:hypothetical protein [Candidatus Kryptobacter tengchongensis]CUS84472.1 hypothetical protein JGI20_00912 [Candidatus Kryptobacter tengchongensis]
MKEIITKAIKKVTLELIYEVVDERTKNILEVVNEIKRRQEEDFRYLNDKIDMQVNQLRQEMGQLRQEIAQLNQKIDSQIAQLNQKIDSQIAQLNQKIDSQIAQLNQRIDTVIQLLIDLKK